MRDRRPHTGRRSFMVLLQHTRYRAPGPEGESELLALLTLLSRRKLRGSSAKSSYELWLVGSGCPDARITRRYMSSSFKLRAEKLSAVRLYESESNKRVRYAW
jgi:hypothetical protein